jgi:hypothetical protein
MRPIYQEKILYNLLLLILVVKTLTACGGGGLDASYIRTEKWLFAII